jgi:hypothetical protein
MLPKFDILVAQIVFYTIFSWQLFIPAQAIDLPSNVDIPEEVLRAEIIIEARSPIDGKALSATEFAELIVNTKQQIELENAMAATSNPKLKETLLLIRLRSFLKSVGIPVK